MHVVVITLIPNLIQSLIEEGVTARAAKNKHIVIHCLNPRDFTDNKHRRVDDKPYGGGPGMVMRIEPLVSALKQAKTILPTASVIFLSPQGKQLNQKIVRETSKNEALILVCGRYEGVDQRFITHYVNAQLSIGDYILTGGELAAMVLIDAVARLLPGTLGSPQSTQIESFEHALLDHPHYTRPAEYRGQAVPSVLRSGDHRAIQAWRERSREEMTRAHRPDLLKNMKNSDVS